MDPLTTIELFAGAGGGCLASVLLRHRIVCYVERDDYAAGVLRARIRDGMLDDAPIWDDVRTFDGRPWRGLVDIVAGGFPCQPFSSAARGRNNEVDLWPEMLRIVGEVLPATVFAENVQRKPVKAAARDLAAIGYHCRATRLSAAALGAAHQRSRWWLLANLDGHGERTKPVDAQVASTRAPMVSGWRRPPPGCILGVDVRTPNRMDRLRTVGNSQVSIVAATAWHLLTGE